MFYSMLKSITVLIKQENLHGYKKIPNTLIGIFYIVQYIFYLNQK